MFKYLLFALLSFNLYALEVNLLGDKENFKKYSNLVGHSPSFAGKFPVVQQTFAPAIPAGFLGQAWPSSSSL